MWTTRQVREGRSVGLTAGGIVDVPPDAHKLTADAVAAEFAAAGWHEASHWDELPYQYVLVFTPPAASAGASH